MPKTRTICMTGGGSAGHVMPHLALLPELKQRGWNCFYVGSHGIEKEIIAKQTIRFYEIPAGKLRRYFSWENFWDVFRIIAGFLKSLWILLRHRPDVVFSKGGFVSVPVALAAWVLRIPVVAHESDLTPGLATRIVLRVAYRVLYAFPETAKYLPKERALFVGAPVRAELFTGSRSSGMAFVNFDPNDNTPILLIMGGSLGAQRLNDAIELALDEILEQFRIIHITGKGKALNVRRDRYRGFEFINQELKDVVAASDFVLSRAGANSIFEFLSLRKPMLLVPLEVGSRGDQIDNAQSFQVQGWAMVLRESSLNETTLLAKLAELIDAKDKMIAKQSTYDGTAAVGRVCDVLDI